MKKNNKKKGIQFENKVRKTINSGALWFDKGDLSTDTHVIECIEENQRILMADFTYKPIKDIQIGDKTIGIKESNKQTRNKRTFCVSTVTNKIDKGIQRIGKLICLNNRQLILTPNHHILGKYKSQSTFFWKEIDRANQLILLQYLPYIYNYRIYLWGMLVGIIDSDGYIKRCKYKNKIYEYFIISQKVACDTVTWLLRKLDIDYSKSKHSTGGYEYFISPKCYKTIKLYYQEFYKYTDYDILYGWLTGFIIGDGCINKEKSGRFSIGQKIGQDYKTLLFVLDKLQITYNIQDNKNDNFIVNIPLTSVPFSGKGKKFKKFQKVLKTRTISSLHFCKKHSFINLDKKAQVYDITTDCGTFIAESFVVHNCKFTEKSGYRITTKLLRKLWEEALEASKLPLLTIGIKDEKELWMLKVIIEKKEVR